MEREAVERDAITCTAAARACEKGRQWRLALLLLASAISRLLSLGLVGCSATLGACEKGRQWERALLLWLGMRRGRLTPDAVVHEAVLTSLARSQQAPRAPRLRRLLQLPGEPELCQLAGGAGRLPRRGRGHQWNTPPSRLFLLGAGRGDASVYCAMVQRWRGRRR
ncbi:unnamed protein product [Prorocentrum cordatum]|uniref:Uncharacterized protein n=1 Tax=Prorocentrum cordatum TaxID=2364126 RepID=A0ABN9TI76_9DINO|nr:unnamed protein product [Polarella glacialis]